MREIKLRFWHKEKKQMIEGLLEFWIKIAVETGIMPDYKNLGVWMQYTGLKDKNGKEIYEGDLVKGKGYTCLIQWQEESMAFVFAGNGWMHDHFIEEMGRDMKDFEIIGNIYENPELLPKGE